MAESTRRTAVGGAASQQTSGREWKLHLFDLSVEMRIDGSAESPPQYFLTREKLVWKTAQCL